MAIGSAPGQLFSKIRPWRGVDVTPAHRAPIAHPRSTVADETGDSAYEVIVQSVSLTDGVNVCQRTRGSQRRGLLFATVLQAPDSAQKVLRTAARLPDRHAPQAIYDFV
jgi:hypothetical protein